MTVTHFTQDYYVQQREKRYGATLDAMTLQQRLDLIPDQPVVQNLLRRAKDNWLLYRPTLLLAMETREQRQRPPQAQATLENW